ncbi:MAG: hypothetical protein AB7S50_12880 [Bacteroidales bacterium]
MRKYLLYLFVFVLLFLSAWIFFFSSSSGIVSLRNSNFSIDNVEKVTSIYLSEKSNTLALDKINNQWIVNNKYQAKEQSIGTLLLAINRLQVHYPVSKAEREQIALLLNNDGIQVDVKINRFNRHRFWVSKPSMNKEKTYMMMVNSSEPFVVKIPGFKGNVGELFATSENAWRNNLIFNYLPQNIQTITIEYPLTPERSFSLKNFNDGSFALINRKNQLEPDFNVEIAARYFTYFQNIQFEDVITNWPQVKKDSVFASTPYVQITVKDFKSIENNIKIFRKQSDGETDEFGDKSKFDLNKAYALLNNNNELLLIQYYNFDPLLKEIDYFR